MKRRVIGSCIKSKEENNENNQIRLLVGCFFSLFFVFFALLFLKVIFLAELHYRTLFYV